MYGANSSFLHFLTMQCNVRMPVDNASSLSSAKATGKTAGKTVGNTETMSKLVCSKKCSNNLAPAARRLACSLSHSLLLRTNSSSPFPWTDRRSRGTPPLKGWKP